MLLHCLCMAVGLGACVRSGGVSGPEAGTLALATASGRSVVGGDRSPVTPGEGGASESSTHPQGSAGCSEESLAVATAVPSGRGTTPPSLAPQVSADAPDVCSTSEARTGTAPEGGAFACQQQPH